jgi:ABC-type multidrug transport system permease subunit
MNARLILTLIKKDLTLFSRNQFYFVMTIVGLVMYVALYFVMPQTLDENIKLGVYTPGILTGSTLAGIQGVEVQPFTSLDELKDAVEKNEYPVGIALPEDLLNKFAKGEQTVVTVYYSASTPEEMKGAINALINQMAYFITGQDITLIMHTEILGPDMLGTQIPWRDRLIPMMAVLILGTEILSLASLISTEIEQDTVRALLVTPLKLRHLLSAKALLGIGLAFIQVVIFMTVIGGLTHEPATMLLGLFVGSILVTGLGFLIASMAHDSMGVTSWGMILFIVFFIPAIGGMVPGILSDWAKIIPSYYLIDFVSRLSNYGATFNELGGNLLIMLGWSAVFGIAGTLALRRRYR